MAPGADTGEGVGPPAGRGGGRRVGPDGGEVGAVADDEAVQDDQVVPDDGAVPDDGVEVLTGGGVNTVVRVGATVRRPTGPWSVRVHDLLRHLERAGLSGVPRFHGTTPEGLEVLDFLPGEVSGYPVTAAAGTHEALVSAARLLREYHDATAAFAAGAPREGWMMPARDPVEVLCHNDYAPHNCVLQGDRVVGLIDFDTAGPGPRTWDVAYAAYRWVPLSDPAAGGVRGTAEEQPVRLREFCDAYGLDAAGRRELVDVVVARLHALVAFVRAEAAAGNAAFAGHLADGHHLLYLGDAGYVAGRRAEFERALLSTPGPDGPPTG